MGVRPSVRPGAGPDQKFELFEFRPMIRDRVESLSVFVWWSRCVVCVFRACFVEACVVGSWSWTPRCQSASASWTPRGRSASVLVSQSESE